ncbi:MAG: hypothetical protein ACOC2F_00510 [Bacteroidota bacterium]
MNHYIDQISNAIYVNSSGYRALLLKLMISITILLSVNVLSAQVHISAKDAIDSANKILWDKFVDKYGIINDFVGERPTPYDCRLSRPNAFGWWTPIENGAFFTGLYLATVCERVKLTNSNVDKDKARILAQGLLKLALVSDVPGFISRGVSTDGKTHYPIGSTDQTIPWFYGLFAYLKSDIPTTKEREIIENKIIEVINAVRLNDWKFPSDGMFTGRFRDNLLENRFLEVSCYLFVLKAMHEITQDKTWSNWYHMALNEKPEGSKKTRAEICSEGILYDREFWKERKSMNYLWIYVKNQASLAELFKLEENEAIKSLYAEGLNNNREFVMQSVKDYNKFDNEDNKVFGNTNWRECYPYWYPQFTKYEAIELSRLKDEEKVGERKTYERDFMTTPLAAASIIALAKNSSDCKLIKEVISHYDYSKLYLSEFFFAKTAYYALP